MRKKRRRLTGRGCGCLVLLLLLLLAAGALLLLSGRERLEENLFPREYEAEVIAACDEYGLDHWLVMAVIREESRFDPDAHSPAGACGLMQLMPATAEWIISQAGMELTLEQALWEPAANIRVGVWYLSWLADDYYHGQQPLAAIAAYNAGHSRVDQWLESGQWDGTLDDISGIPYAETRQYLQYVDRSRQYYQELYG